MSTFLHTLRGFKWERCGERVSYILIKKLNEDVGYEREDGRGERRLAKTYLVNV